MKFFNLIVFSLLVYNLVLASPIKKKCNIYIYKYKYIIYFLIKKFY